MENKFISKIGKNDLLEFIQICKDLGFEFDSERFESIVSNTIKYLNGDKGKRIELRYMQELENRWYDSLKNQNPDYSVYDDVYYLADTWVCWKKYAREYIRSIISDKSMACKSSIGWYNLMSIKQYMGYVSSIVDLGCGIGYSSALFKEVFNCNVYGTNLKNTKQYEICKFVSQKSGFNLVENIDNLGKIDVVFASEYFEHFEKPIEHLIDVLEKLSPKYILFANTFNAKSIGHFDRYIHKSNYFSGRQTSLLFSQELKSRGYKKIKTNCFNNRPNFYKYEK